jgi:hypothetical protein
MDPTRFDTLARAFATGGTRRRLVAVLATLPLGGVLFGLEDKEAAAEHPRHRVKRRNQQRKRKQRNERRKKDHKKKRNNKKGGKGGANPNTCTANGQACQQNRDCCGGNCFGQVCAAPVSECGGVDCPPGATGCCTGTCCQSPANQCNALGECCAPNCAGKQCGPDGCGNTGTCGTCPSGSECDKDTGQCGCSPQTCPNGCCDANGVCQPGNTEQACGDGGVTCTVCGPNQTCSTQTGTCRDKPPCSPATCPNGCCDELQDVCRTDQRSCAGPGSPCCAGCCEGNFCLPGNDVEACGVGGVQCRPCPVGTNCDEQGQCLCNRDFCPDGCCENGPGQPGQCFNEGTPGVCGTGGVLCGRPNGTPCSGDDGCCSGNSFNHVCADIVNQCGGITCTPPANGCADGPGFCCYNSLSCGASCCMAGPDGPCCGDICCDAGQICTNGDCCPPGQTGCNGNCCDTGQQCCPNGSCCDTDQQCCDSTCCSFDQTCCVTICCNAGQQCCKLGDGNFQCLTTACPD